DLSSTVANAGDTIVDLLSTKGSEIVSMVLSRTDEAARALIDSGETVSRSFGSTNERLRTDVAGIVDRLSQSNEMLNALLTRTTENLNQIETDLAARTGEFAQAIEQAIGGTQNSSTLLASQVEMLRDVSKDVLENVGAIAGRFEDQGRSLSLAASSLSAANSEVETSIEQRRVALDQLAQSLAARSADLDGVMRTFTETVNSSLKEAEERAAEVAKTLARSSEAAAKGVLENLEGMQATASSESLKAANVVREANRALMDDMAAVVAQATKQFSAATDEMRSAAKEMQQDLETTRTELKRGVLELPAETRESADAMRRVVTDQLKALTELSDIVGKHGKSLDVSVPGTPAPAPRGRVAEAAPAAFARPQPVAAQAVRQPEPVRAVAPAPAPQRPAAAARPATVEAARPAAQVQAPAPTPVRQPAQPTRTEAKSAPAAGQAEPRGWVSDLLRRASRDEDQAAAAPAERREAAAPAAGNGASLGNLSTDIARAIDPRAAAELWERHHRGEKNVFTRRLYTLAGQQTFDEIRRKYQGEADFKAAVDRYVGDFERLLKEVARNGQDASASSAYLVSDTGKVYTMLAHASGRFD
ncbi:MAG: hypothetical protein J0H21_11145, partial [Rhizobiales bacterium]|nr:hypothetical protein [Hyphomicrobiales bacterium]